MALICKEQDGERNVLSTQSEAWSWDISCYTFHWHLQGKDHSF